MARYGKQHKEQTRRRIIEAAGQRLKRDGIDGSGVSVLMADAGLTNGAFYAHFESKEDLVATAVADQLASSSSATAPRPPTVRESSSWCANLSIEHRDAPEHGCPSAALLDEIGRCSDTTSVLTPRESWNWSTRSLRSSLPVILTRRGDRRSACSRY